MALATSSSLEAGLRKLGLDKGDTVMVHASLRAVGPIEGRAEVLVNAIINVLTDTGTLMAYVDYEPTEAAPNFDIVTSPARSDYGVFAEIVRTWPEACRSANPGASVSAIDQKARWICENHPMNYGYGEKSPFAKLVKHEGKVLLLGADFDHVTLIHHAEHLANLANKRVIQRPERICKDGKIAEVTIEEFDTGKPVVEGMPKFYFKTIVEKFIESNDRETGRVGSADSFLLPARGLVNFAIAKMEAEFGN